MLTSLLLQNWKSFGATDEARKELQASVRAFRVRA
jgi:hypothetical protein